MTMQQGFSSAADGGPPAPGGRGRSIILPTPAPTPRQPSAPGRREQPPAAAPSRGGGGVAAAAPGPSQPPAPPRGSGRGQAFVVPTPAAPAPPPPPRPRGQAALREALRRHGLPPGRPVGRDLPPDNRRAPGPWRPPQGQPDMRRGPQGPPRDDQRQGWQGPPRPQGPPIRPRPPYGDRGDGGPYMSDRGGYGPVPGDRGSYGPGAGDRGSYAQRGMRDRGGSAQRGMGDRGGFPQRGMGDRGGFAQRGGGPEGSQRRGGDREGFQRYGGDRGGGGGGGAGWEPRRGGQDDRFLTADDLEDRAEKERLWRARQFKPKGRGDGPDRRGRRGGRGGRSGRGGRGEGGGLFHGPRAEQRGSLYAEDALDNEFRGPSRRRGGDPTDDESDAVGMPVVRKKKKLPDHLNPYRDPDESEEDDEFDTDEELSDSEKKSSAPRLSRGRGRGRKGEDEEVEEQLFHDFYDPQEDAALRELLQRRLDMQPEQYPEGPAQLPAADPETMPSETEAMDHLQRVMKMELVDEHMQMNFGDAPQNYWGLEPHRLGEDGQEGDEGGEEDMTPAQLLEHLRPELEWHLNIAPGDDEAWESIIDGAAEGVEQFQDLQAPDVWAEEAQLRALVDDNVPQGHEMRAHVDASLATVLANAGWPYEDKHKFLVQLLGELCEVKLPHLWQKRAARA
ncbi:hypothetical protein WJX81_004591 [Elliptochloris bilobata]|uniref:Uncharacterized protein n=1 Tax=Elliptochloris bilobata TaxID=381761 RepID=A0AAW1SH49_9CHLO